MLHSQDESFPDSFGGMPAIRQMQEQDESGAAVHHRADRGPVVCADDQVTLPMAWNLSVLGLWGSL